MNKLTKLLSIVAVSATLGAGVVGLVGCGGGGDDSGNGHQHNYTWVDKGDGTHEEYCNVDGCPDPVGQSGAHTFDSNNICTACGVKFAIYEFIPSDVDAQKYADGYQSGVFSLTAGTEVRTRSRENYSVYDYANGYYGNSSAAPVKTGFNASKSVKLGGANDGLTVNAIGSGKITVYVDNGSSGIGAEDFQKLAVTKPDGSTEQLDFAGKGLYAVTINCDVAGSYTIGRVSGTVDLYYAKFETAVEVTPVEKIEVVSGGKTVYLKGENFDSSKLQVQLVRKTTGTIEPIALKDVTIDSSAFKKDVPGEYKITVSYVEDGETFKDEYTVTVYAVSDIEIGLNKIVQGSNTTAGNGQYINHAVKQFYFNDEELSTDGLTVKAVLDEEGKEKMIVTNGFTVTGFNKGTAGKQTITVAWTENPEIKKTFDVYVAAYTAASITANQEIKISVDGNLADAQVGVRADGVYQFKTVQQSLEFLNALSLDKNVKKVINLAEGTYKERLEVTIPNLTIKGADNTHPEKTVIEWDSLVGIADESGFVHVTDSTATLNIRDKAVGFVIEGVTISNWYNSTEHFDEKFGPNYGEHRALAMLVQADKVVIDNCRLLGYQDTIEFFTGRQMVTNTYICGRTDFIFGTNNTTYFKDCTIESIVDGGYVTAFKGNNKGDNDYVKYGTIFDGCNFIAPESVVEKANTSLGRTWAKYAAVAYVNCNFGGHISTKAYGNGSGTRYTAMNALPTESTVKFVEYNNTGAGAITEKQDGVTLLTDAAEGAKYSDLSIIFSTTNGGVTYTDEWDGAKGVTITVFDYKFSDYYTANDGKTYHAIPAGGEALFGDAATVKGTKWGHELNQDKDHAKFDVNTVIEFNVAGKVTVTTYGSSYGLPENIQITYTDGKAVITIVATEASPISNGCYITAIQLDTNDIPANS